ncbi:MAG: hypothetical protein WC867_04145 [Candidatus Pacearchaeota archaeon]|jgi:hypothetical protein
MANKPKDYFSKKTRAICTPFLIVGTAIGLYLNGLPDEFISEEAAFMESSKSVSPDELSKVPIIENTESKNFENLNNSNLPPQIPQIENTIINPESNFPLNFIPTINYNPNENLNYSTVGNRKIYRSVYILGKDRIVQPSTAKLGIESRFWSSLPQNLSFQQLSTALRYAPMEFTTSFVMKIPIKKEDILKELYEGMSQVKSRFGQSPILEERFTFEDELRIKNLLNNHIMTSYPQGSTNTFRINNGDPEFISYNPKTGERKELRITGIDGKSFEKFFENTLYIPDKFDNKIIAINNIYKAYQSR